MTFQTKHVSPGRKTELKIQVKKTTTEIPVAECRRDPGKHGKTGKTEDSAFSMTVSRERQHKSLSLVTATAGIISG